MQASDYYQQGMQHVESGDIHQALQVWEQAQKGSPEPRIGIAYLEHATAAQLSQYYEKATEMYYWGLSGESFGDDAEVLEREIEHWKRIAHAREHFDRAGKEPYRTDDRGPVYVRYGKPALVRSGQQVTREVEFEVTGN